MDRQQKILKAVLLLRKFNRYESKEKQMADADKFYSDQQLDEWIEMLKHTETEEEHKEQDEIITVKEYHYTPSACNGDYSPSNPWNAPGMSIHDFI